MWEFESPRGHQPGATATQISICARRPDLHLAVHRLDDGRNGNIRDLLRAEILRADDRHRAGEGGALFRARPAEERHHRRAACRQQVTGPGVIGHGRRQVPGERDGQGRAAGDLDDVLERPAVAVLHVARARRQAEFSAV